MSNIYNKDDANKIIKIVDKYIAKNSLQSTYLFLFNNFIYILSIFCIFKSIKSKNNIFLMISVIICSLLILRNFMVFHDLHHRSFFPSNERKNNTFGINRILGIIYDFIYWYDGLSWFDTHSKHHKILGETYIKSQANKNDTARTVITSSEYIRMNFIKRKLYDIIR
tara:strand:- start:493 stop:993 length:501 start_codon:yes stop_codon:yes gene_type:complete